MNKTVTKQNNWQEVKLGDIFEIQNGYSFKSSDYVDFISDELEVLKMGHIERGGGLRKEPKKNYIPRSEKLKKWILDKGNIVIAMTDMKDNVVILGVPALIDKDNHYVLNQRVAGLRLKEKNVDLDFVYNYLKWNEFLGTLRSKANSGVQVNLTTDAIKNSIILLPPPQEQKAIGEMLSILDEKIDLLHRQNKTLEDMTQALFRKYFVEEVKDDWEILDLSTIAEVKNGFAFSSNNYTEYIYDNLEVFKMGHIEKGGGLRSNPKKDYVPRNDQLERYILNKGDIVMAMTDMKDNVVILGVPAMIDKDNHYVLNQRVARIYLKNDNRLISSYLLYIQLKNKNNIANLQSKANSGVQVNLSIQTIKDIEIIVPPMQVQKEKGQIIIDLYLKKENNDTKIRTLENLRDTLLPKLMSGEVRL